MRRVNLQLGLALVVGLSWQVVKINIFIRYLLGYSQVGLLAMLLVKLLAEYSSTKILG